MLAENSVSIGVRATAEGSPPHINMREIDIRELTQVGSSMVTDIPSRQLEVISGTKVTLEENLVMDEQYAREAGQTGRRVLRLWWGGRPTAVLGCGDKPEQVLDLDECSRREIGWVRRVTGGGTVLQTAGVLNYTYTAPDPGCLDISKTFKNGAEFVICGLSHLGIEAKQCGISDVAVGNLKISGNAQARKWHAILLHGTILVDIDYELLGAVLKHPIKEPEYRKQRRHKDFMVTLRDLGVTKSQIEIEDSFVRAATAISPLL